MVEIFLILGATFLLAIATVACSDVVLLFSNDGAFAAQLNFVSIELEWFDLLVFLDFLASTMTYFIVLAA